MVLTHLPSNILLLLVPLMPNVKLAVLLLLARFSISQMDVPTRQSYTIAVVSPGRAIRSGGNHRSGADYRCGNQPAVRSFLFARPGLINVPFYIAGALKIVYDLLLYKEFISTKPPEEQR